MLKLCVVIPCDESKLGISLKNWAADLDYGYLSGIPTPSQLLIRYWLTLVGCE